MKILNSLLIVLLICFSSALAFTRQDLERMKFELDNPITLETLDTLLLESGYPFEKQISQYSNRPNYQGVCKFISSSLPVYVSTEFDYVTSKQDTSKEKIILRKIHYGPNKDHSAYRFVNGRFQYHKDTYWDKDPEKRQSVELIIQKSNSILDKIDQFHFGCENPSQCRAALQTLTLYQFSEMLGSQGICSGEGPLQTCNYRITLDDGEIADMTIKYLNSGDEFGHDYTPLSIIFNDVENSLLDSVSVKTVKIGKQEWMDHNLLYGEGLTMKYGVANDWLVFMDLNLHRNDYDVFIEKPDIKKNHQGVCPIGFHVPTFAEWKELFSFVAKDKVKFSKYDLFDAYAENQRIYEYEWSGGWGKLSSKGKAARDKMSKIQSELDAAYNNWRKGRKDGFFCRDKEKCSFNLRDMQNVLKSEIIKHLCMKGAWPLDENGEDVCMDTYGFAMPSDNIKGNEMSYWTSDAKISQCNDVFENGRHQCTYEVKGYGFTINNEGHRFIVQDVSEWMMGANLRCLKNRSKK